MGASIGLLLTAGSEAFGAAQEGALEVCEGKRALAVNAGELLNLYLLTLQATREREQCQATKGWRFWKVC